MKMDREQKSWLLMIVFLVFILIIACFGADQRYYHGLADAKNTLQTAPVETAQKEMAEAQVELKKSTSLMEPPKMEVMSNFVDLPPPYAGEARYILVDGHLAVEVRSPINNRSLAFVPPDCGASEGQ